MSEISLNSIKMLLGEHFCTGNNINENTQYEILNIDPRKLITAKRIDIVAKYLYLKSIDDGYESSYYEDLYNEHIKAFTHGTFSEPGNQKKNNISSYRSEFKKLFNDIKHNGFDYTRSIIPVGADFEILDGAHRAACAIYLNLPIKVIRFSDISFNFGYEYFKNELLDSVYLNHLLEEYCKIKDNVYVANIWPVASNKETRNHLGEVFNKYGSIIAEFDIDISYLGYRNYMSQIYIAHDWVGNFENNFKSVMSKVDPCYAPGVPLHIVVFESNNIFEVLKLKKEVRSLFNIGNHSIHISDNSVESLQMIRLLLNENSLCALNNTSLESTPEFSKIMQSLLGNDSYAHNDNEIIVADSLLSIYGIRDCDLIKFSSLSKFDQPEEVRLVNECISNPSKHGYFYDMKFLAIEEYIKIKKIKGTEKDINDISLLREAISKFEYSRKLSFDQKVRRLFKLVERKLFLIGSYIFKKMCIYNLMRKIYRNINKGRT